MPQTTGVRRLILLFLLSSVAAGIWSTLTVSNGWAAVRSTLGQPPNARVASDWRAPQSAGVARNRRHRQQRVAAVLLFGNTTIESGIDVRSAGSVAAFPFVDRVPGVVSAITVYVDSRSKAKHLIVALYSNRGRQPGSRVAIGSRRSPSSGGWDTVKVSRVRAKAGRTYWIAVLAQGGPVYLRDTHAGGRHRRGSRSSTLHSLPPSWNGGRRSKPLRISAFVSGTRSRAISVPAASARAFGRSPTSRGVPIITGVARQGQTLTTSTGSWSGHPSPYSYGWEDCDGTGATCTLITGASSSSYAVQASDVGRTIRSVVTATNTSGSTTAQSSPTAAVTPLPPANTSPPSIAAGADQADVLSATVGLEAIDVGSGERAVVTAADAGASPAQQGDTLTTTNGTWTNSPTGYSYQWQDCNSSGGSCSNITGATSSSHTIAVTDENHTIAVTITASNAGGSASASSAATSLVPDPPPPAPVNTALPAITGTAQQGDTLTTTNGTWTNSPTGYSYQWQDCLASLCTNIGGATGSSYVLQSSDVGDTIDVIVTAINAGGSTPVTSTETQTVASPPPPAPVNTALPAITGTAQQGDTLTTTNGTWTNSPTGYSYQWQDCNSSGGSCSNITGATSSSHTIAVTDENHTIAVTITASNAGGSASASSAATSLVPDPPPPAPVNTALPAITGTAQQGDTLTTTNGTWTNSPTGYSYQWQDCNSSGGSCSNITGATSSSHTIAVTDENHTIAVTITASNAGGSASASSAATSLVPDPPPPAPVNTALPAITGTAQQGDTLTTTNGTWTNSPTGYSYQWQDCNSSGGSCSNITGATSSSHTIAVTDENHTIAVTITASNAGGSASASSAATSLVPDPPPPAPVNTALPAITGTAQQGDTLTTTNGTWTNSPTGYSYQWQDCNSSGGSCSNITGATSSSHTIAVTDENHTIAVTITASNAGGSASASSAATGVVGGGGSLSCDLNATTSNFTTQIANATPGQVVCLASGDYSTFTGTSKSVPRHHDHVSPRRDGHVQHLLHAQPEQSGELDARRDGWWRDDDRRRQRELWC